MATAAQIKALLESYKNGDDRRFKSIATQIAAHEANKGNTSLSKELNELISKFSERTDNKISSLNTVSIIEPRGELAGLFEAKYTHSKLSQLILPEYLDVKLKRIVEEQNQQQKLREYGLAPRSKILLIGAPGTGKTMTASALAGQLNLPLFTIQLDAIITKYMGEASMKLRLIFDHIKRIRGVYFFDEFDAIGSSRGANNDVGEIRRILNSFLQFMENSRSDSLILAATNLPELLDTALFRRFDDILKYNVPDEILRETTFKKYLSRNYISKNIDWSRIMKASNGLSYAEISKISENALKINVLDGVVIDTELLLSLINEKQNHLE